MFLAFVLSSAWCLPGGCVRCGGVSLRTDDLEKALREYGVPLHKPPYYADSVTAGLPTDGAPSKAPPSKGHAKGGGGAGGH